MPTSIGTLTADGYVQYDGTYSRSDSDPTLVWSYEDSGSLTRRWYTLFAMDGGAGPIPVGAMIDSVAMRFLHRDGAHTESVKVGVEDSATPSEPSGDGSDLDSKDVLLSSAFNLVAPPGSPPWVTLSSVSLSSLIQSLLASVGEIEEVLLFGSFNAADLFAEYDSAEGLGIDDPGDAPPELEITWHLIPAAVPPFAYHNLVRVAAGED